MEDLPVSESLEADVDVDVSRPHTARMYDYYLGGKNHFAADRELADKVLASMPSARSESGPLAANSRLAVRILVADGAQAGTGYRCPAAVP